MTTGAPEEEEEVVRQGSICLVHVSVATKVATNVAIVSGEQYFIGVQYLLKEWELCPQIPDGNSNYYG